MKPDEPPLDPALPTTLTTSGRVVYDPTQASRPAADPAAAANLRTVLDELSADHGDARHAVPEPVDLAPATEGGALISGEAQDAARAHVAAVVAHGPVPARLDIAAVNIADTRRAPTARIERLGPWAREGAAAREAAAFEIERDALPSSTAGASSRAPSSTEPEPEPEPAPRALGPVVAGARAPRADGAGRSGARTGAAASLRRAPVIGRTPGVLAGERSLWSGGRWFVAAAVLVLLLAGGVKLRGWGAASDAGSGSEIPGAPTLPTGVSTSALVSTALPGSGSSAPPFATEMPAASSAPSPSDTPGIVTAPTTAPAGSARPAPARTGDPYADAGTPTATKTAPNAPSTAPTVAPAVSSSPTVAPAATTAAPSTSSTAPTTIKTVPPSWIDKE